jgi:hypothetical protein
VASKREVPAIVPSGDGEIKVKVHATSSTPAGTCTGDGEETYDLAALKEKGALNYFILQVGSNGRYWLSLGMSSFFIQPEVKYKCRWFRGVRGPTPANERG